MFSRSFACWKIFLSKLAQITIGELKKMLVHSRIWTQTSLVVSSLIALLWVISSMGLVLADPVASPSTTHSEPTVTIVVLGILVCCAVAAGWLGIRWLHQHVGKGQLDMRKR